MKQGGGQIQSAPSGTWPPGSPFPGPESPKGAQKCLHTFAGLVQKSRQVKGRFGVTGCIRKRAQELGRRETVPPDEPPATFSAPRSLPGSREDSGSCALCLLPPAQQARHESPCLGTCLGVSIAKVLEGNRPGARKQRTVTENPEGLDGRSLCSFLTRRSGGHQLRAFGEPLASRPAPHLWARFAERLRELRRARRARLVSPRPRGAGLA